MLRYLHHEFTTHDNANRVKVQVVRGDANSLTVYYCMLYIGECQGCLKERYSAFKKFSNMFWLQYKSR